jgi:putative addiction module killer protein
MYPLRYNATMNSAYEISEYVTENGRSPFGDWFLGLKDKRAQARLQLRLDRITLGNFGDWKSVEGVRGLYELRDHYAQGYRIYYTITDRTVVLLLAGSTKRDQQRTITQADKYLADYHEREKHREKSDPPT